MPTSPIPGQPLETLSEGLDLAALRRADRAIQDAAVDAITSAMQERLSEAVAALDPVLHPVVELLLPEIGRAVARAEAAAQAALENRRSRGEWISLDPLRHIPPGRATPRPTPPRRAVLTADETAFVGYGWHEAEGAGADRWRWSQAGRNASIVLPSLGGGPLTIRLDLVAPFDVVLDPEAVSVMANGEPLDLYGSRMEGSRATLSGGWTAPEDEGQGSFALVIRGPAYADATGRDQRSLGLGVHRVVVERN